MPIVNISFERPHVVRFLGREPIEVDDRLERRQGLGLYQKISFVDARKSLTDLNVPVIIRLRSS